MNYRQVVRSVAPYVIAAVSGSLLAGFSPDWLLLPAFFTCLAMLVVLLWAANRIPTPAQWSPGKRFVLLLLAVTLGSANSEVESGPAPGVLVMALLFTVAFVFTLAVSASAA
jgi:hypothetical protein